MRIIIILLMLVCTVSKAQPILINLTGGTSGQILTKGSSTACDYSWQTPAGGADSVTFYTKYRSDTSRANIYAALAGKQASGSYVFQSTTVNGHALSGNVSVTTTDLSLQNVTNTSDANKPVSTAQQTALDLKANLASPTLTTPNIGAATGTSLTATGTIVSTGTAGIGYGTGAGGTVTQTGNRSSGVTINKISGAITTVTTSLAAGAEATFVVTNSTVAVGDVVLVSARSGQTAATSIPFVTAVANGSFSITLSNFNASTADTGAMIINFVVIKAVSN